MANDSRPRTVSIVIPNYNGESLIPTFLPSVITSAQAYPGRWELIVVDDCSPDKSVREIERLRAEHSNMTLVVNKRNLGFPATCNIGFRNAIGDLVMFLNNDVMLPVDFFQYFSEHFEDPSVFAVTVCGKQYPDGPQVDGLKLLSWKSGFVRATANIFDDQLTTLGMCPPFRSFGVQGAYFFVDADKMRQLGGFNEIYSPFLYEETDLAYRAMKRGWIIHYEPRSIAHHQVGSTTRSSASARARKVLAARNRLIFTWINIHDRKLFAEHLLHLTLRLFTLHIIYWRATVQALGLLGSIRVEREKEEITGVVTDDVIIREGATASRKSN